MWRMDTSYIEKCLSITDEFVSDFFNWSKSRAGHTKEDIEKFLKRDMSPFGKVANSLSRLFELIVSFTLFEKKDIEKIFRNYKTMTSDYFLFLNSGAQVCILPDVVKDKTEEIFHYFYNGLIDTKTFWSHYPNGEGYFPKSRLRTEIGSKYPICPYCDANSIAFFKESNSDHFLAKTHFPFLSVHWKNLVVSCIGCNLYIKNDKFIGTKQGKAENLPIFHPYNDEAANYIWFNFNDNLNIAFKNSTDDRVNNYRTLFELDNKYLGIKNEVVALWESILEDIKDQYKENVLIVNESNHDRLERIYKKIVLRKKRELNNLKGKVKYTKLFTDLFNHKLSDLEMQNEISFLKYELRIISKSKINR